MKSDDKPDDKSRSSYMLILDGNGLDEADREAAAALLNTLKLRAARKDVSLSYYLEAMSTFTEGDESAVDRRVDEMRRIDERFPV
jgi:hypothetical protein